VASELLHDPNLSSLTKKSYQGVLTPFVAQYGTHFIDKVQRAQIEVYLQSPIGRNVRTHNRHHTIIKRLFTFAAERDYLTHNPAAHIKRKKPLISEGEHGSDELVPYLKKTERNALYKRSARNFRLPALITLLHESGARVAEVLALNTASINFKSCEFQVVGKGNKKRWCYFAGNHSPPRDSYFWPALTRFAGSLNMLYQAFVFGCEREVGILKRRFQRTTGRLIRHSVILISRAEEDGVSTFSWRVTGLYLRLNRVDANQ
jgi:site-specific recombinase XerD